MKSLREFRRAALAVGLLLHAGTLPVRAQWSTEAHELKSGWNAIYLHVDPSHLTLDALVTSDAGNKVDEIWMWAPNPDTAQFVTSPQSPSQPAYWLKWARGGGASVNLDRLRGNVACLVKASADYTWNIVGKPVVPRYQWSGSGLNFLGFPTPPGAGAPTFDTYFTSVPDLRYNSEIFGYAGGPIESNPVQILDLTVAKARRGEAFWIRSPQFNRYFGPFELAMVGETGLRFGEAAGQVSFRIRNHTAAPLTVTLTGVASEPVPSGQPAIQGPVPVLVRGELNTATLAFSHAALADEPRTWTLPAAGEPGSDVEVVLGVNRQAMTGAAGSQYAGILRVTDSAGHSRIDVPVSATVPSSAGLWVGEASVNRVSQYLTTYAKAAGPTELTNILGRLGLAEGLNGYHYEIDPATRRVLVYGGPAPAKTGSYLVDGPVRTDTSSVPRPFPLRLIVHHDGTSTRMLQKVFYGPGPGTENILCTRESLLDATKLASARRISAVHLPTAEASPIWPMTGNFRAGSAASATIETAYDDPLSNPFVHAYHPDHDNLDAKFATTLARGAESWGIRRQITLSFTAPASDFASLTDGATALRGDYAEVVTVLGGGGSSRQYDVRGTFSLRRLSEIAALTTP